MARERRGWDILRCPALFAVLLAVALPRAAPVGAAGVVGTGTPESCTEAALDTALAGGGTVTFDCGPAPVTITQTFGKVIADGTQTTVDGGGLVTLSGGNAVPVFLVSREATLDARNLTIADGHANDEGGGISNLGSLTVTNSTFSGNSAGQAGGGIDNRGSLTITNSSFSSNSAVGAGGGIANTGSLTITNSSFSANSTEDAGGGIYFSTATFDSALTVTNSAFSSNVAGSGGAISIIGGVVPVTVTNSTFSGNGAEFDGGGIFSNHGQLTVTNSTFADNSAGHAADTSGKGGGIYNTFGTVTVINSTFSGNGAGDGGGGMDNGDSGTATASNTIFANSTSGGNCSGVAVADGGHNIDDGATCGFTGTGCATTSGSSFCNTEPQLDPAGLANNGGPTQTIALCAGIGIPNASCTNSTASPGINAGDESVCDNPPVSGVDQRGFVRPGTGHTQCSIGAYEADAILPETCVGDCDATGSVTVDEVITLVNIALGEAELSTCSQGVPSGAEVDVSLIIQAVISALYGCSG